MRNQKIRAAQLLQILGLLALAVVLLMLLNNKETTPSQQKKLSNEQVAVSQPTKGSGQHAKFKLRVNETALVQPGLVLVTISGTEEVLLLNRDGEVVHRWSGIDAARARLYPDCQMLIVHGSKWGLQYEKWRARKKFLTVYDWDGDILREYEGEDVIHHDAHLLDNGHFLFLESEMIPYPSSFAQPPRDTSARIKSDRVYEVDQEGDKVYSWQAEKHLSLEQCGWHGCEKREMVKEDRKHIWDWTHINTLSPIPPNKHFEGGDVRFRPGNLLIIPRNFWHAYLLDRETGRVIWDYSGDGEERDYTKRLVRGHEIHMISKELPGAGNLLLFDNGSDGVREYSQIREIDPMTKQTLWSYKDPKRFYSRGGGSVQRLPNGNTLISEDKRGRIFEVTPEGKIVWSVKTKYRINRAHKYYGNICSQLNDSEV